MPTCGGIGTYLPNYHTMQVSGQGKNTTLYSNHCDPNSVNMSSTLFTLIMAPEMAPEMTTIFDGGHFSFQIFRQHQHRS